jgi:hypothetical protein
VREKESKPTVTERFDKIWNAVADGIDPSRPELGTVVNGHVRRNHGDTQTVLVWASKIPSFNREITPPKSQQDVKLVSAFNLVTKELFTVKSTDLLETPDGTASKGVHISEQTKSSLGQIAAIKFESEPAI